MSEPKGFFQKLFKVILSQEKFEDAERESRLWMLQCSNCKYERSVWDMGGVRWKAAGNPRVYRLCPNCNQQNWHVMYKKNA
jgi:hypothetical protein